MYAKYAYYEMMITHVDEYKYMNWSLSAYFQK